MLSENRPTRPAQRMVTASFRDREAAERAYQVAMERGYGRDDVHVIMSQDTRKDHFDAKREGAGSKALEGAGAGGAIGGTVGATLAAIAAAATTLTIPGIGLVIAGPLAGALAGGAVGAATGGLIGTLIGAGIPEDQARRYEKDLAEGAIVLGVDPVTEEDADFIEREWKNIGHHAHR